jgi:uncharacterized protein YdiU (UPF0061 family)
MSSELMNKTAAVLEAVADQLDQQERQRQASAREERMKVAQALGEKVASATGEELSQDTLERLADSDVDIIDAFTKLAERTPEGEPEEMGTGGDIRDNAAAASTRKEQEKIASEEADERFLDWVMS